MYSMMEHVSISRSDLAKEVETQFLHQMQPHTWLYGAFESWAGQLIGKNVDGHLPGQIRDWVKGSDGQMTTDDGVDL